MGPRHCVFYGVALATIIGSATWVASPQEQPNIRVNVEMVQLNVAVTDTKGNYVTGLRPSDFQVAEDGISQKMAMFAVGNEAPKKLGDLSVATSITQPAASSPAAGTSASAAPYASAAPAASSETAPSGAENVAAVGSADALISPLAGADVFILFDTSNYMYRGFVFAQDAVANFVRSLDGPDRVAFYAYSRDLLRAAPMSGNRVDVLKGVRETVAGADAALYDALLLTLRDAGQMSGRKAIVVFSNGPDNISVAPPEDVRELAQSEGVPIYMISTREAKIEPISTAVFQRMTDSTGGQVYFAKSWQEEEKAFASIRDDLAHVYSVFYYPQPNPNRGWRALKVKLADPRMNKYVIRTRTGYRPQTARLNASAGSGSGN
jgi:Ca-activated chloride channel homolog